MADSVDCEAGDADSGAKEAAAFNFGPLHYFAEGVKNDFQKFVDRFKANGSVRFEDFLVIWHDMHMYHLLRGRQTKAKLKEFTEECLSLACELWVESADFQVQVCGLYLLYGIYFSQLVETTSRIRMTLPMWKSVQEFIVSVKEYQHYDVEFVYMKLLVAKAFYFVYTISNDNLIQTHDYRRKKMIEQGEDASKETATMIGKLLEPDNLLKLQVIDQQYQQIKRNLSGEQRTPDLSLSVTQTDLVEAITKDVTTFKSRRLGAVNAPGVDKGNDVSLQAELKQKAMIIKKTERRQKPKPKNLRSRNDDIDEAAMGAAVLHALSDKPSTSSFAAFTLPAVADLSSALVIDEDDVDSDAKKGKKSTSKSPAKKSGGERSKSVDKTEMTKEKTEMTKEKTEVTKEKTEITKEKTEQTKSPDSTGKKVSTSSSKNEVKAAKGSAKKRNVAKKTEK